MLGLTTREVEKLLRGQGLSATPFLPSLLHEAHLGFDVAFHRPGVPLLLQFKLGQAMRRFVPGPRPPLQQTFWRCHIDTSERAGQFELLLKAERDGAEVYYVAPRFHEWESFLQAFEEESILESSLLLSPGQIGRIIEERGLSSGRHKIVYDDRRTYICSEPLEIFAQPPDGLPSRLRARIERSEPLIRVLEEVLEGLRVSLDGGRISAEIDAGTGEPPEVAVPPESPRARRIKRMSRLRTSGRSAEESIALALGAEIWSASAQLLLITELGA